MKHNAVELKSQTMINIVSVSVETVMLVSVKVSY